MAEKPKKTFTQNLKDALTKNTDQIKKAIPEVPVKSPKKAVK